MEEDKRVSGFLLGCGVAFIGIVGAGFLFGWLPQKRGAERASNERSASTVLKILSSAEADFQANDRDGNGVADFWTGDVAGLFRWGLIERGVAEADTSPLNPLVPRPIPYRGYYYEVLRLDNSVTPPEAYGQDTDKKSGKVHNVNRFGFVAYPADSGGKYYFMINENNSVFRAAATIPRPTNWFTHNERMNFWSMPQ